MKTRYFIVAAMISGGFAVFFYYYHVWLVSSRHGTRMPHSELLLAMAQVAAGVAGFCLTAAVAVAVLRAVKCSVGR